MLILVFLLPILIQCQHIDNLVEKLRHLESFVELKGGSFRMGVNDRHGINMEYPVKQAHVQPFRYRRKKKKNFVFSILFLNHLSFFIII